MKLGEKLNLLIKQKNMTVNQVAVEANVPPSSLYSIIQRNSTKVDIDSFIRICNVLACKPEDFSDEILKVSLPENIQVNNIIMSDEKQLLEYYRSFNSDGKEEALKRLSEMAQLEQYKKGFGYNCMEEKA